MSKESVNYEQAIITILRTLPRERQSQLFDFARFMQRQLKTSDLQNQQVAGDPDDPQCDGLDTGETEAEVEADNKEWDILVSSAESQSMLETMARQARQQFQAGKTRPMCFEGGRLKQESRGYE